MIIRTDKKKDSPRTILGPSSDYIQIIRTLLGLLADSARKEGGV